MDLLGRVLGSRYRLDARLGVGGSARVYRARDLMLGRDVAVKVLHPALSDDARFVRRFEAEARAAAGLEHQAIVRVHDVGEDGVCYTVLEYVQGGSLQDLLDEGRTLSPSQAARLGAEVCSALAFAHEQGVVHRDIKPGNILLTTDGQAKVVDFGLARALAEAAWTEPLDVVLGTARYASPEVLAGESAGPEADLYALGLVLAEAVSGEPVFTGDTPAAVLGSKRGPPRWPDGLGALREVVGTAAARGALDRFRDAAEMEEALSALAGGPPVEPARGHGEGGVQTEETRAPSAAPRHRSRALLLVLALLVVIAGAAPAWVYGPGARTVAATRGLDVDTARKRLEGQGLAVVVGAPLPDGSVPEGLVVGSEPPEGARVRWRAGVRLVLSAGLPRLTVPALEGKPLDEAVRELGKLGLRPGAVRVEASDRSTATVLRHDTGTRRVGETVALTVSSGFGAPSEVPDVLGASKDDALARIRDAGLSVSAEEAFDDTVPAGSVVSQDPGAGALVRPGRDVAIVVSRGPDLVDVPDVRGMTVDDAVARLRAAGLEPSVSAVVGSEFVLKTDPDRGARVKRGSPVVVFTI